MNSKQRADIIAWIHFFWILFGLVSLPLIFFISFWHKVALAFVGITVFSWLIFRGCWFLQLENEFRKLYNPADSFEEEAFLQHYLKKYLKISCSRLSVRITIYSYMIILTLLAIQKLR